MSRSLRTTKIDFLGSGWKFPPRLNAMGQIELSDDEVDVDEAIKIILLTRKGERPLRPEFGSELHSPIFEPNDAATGGLARRYVMEALARWEPRIEVTAVDVRPHPHIDGAMRIEVDYKVPSLNSERNLVFPFYTIPGESP